MKKTLLIAVLILGALVLASPAFSQGCSQCRMLSDQASGVNDLEEASFGSNINYGILYLMIIPYLILMFLFRKRIFGFLGSLLKK